MTLNPGYCTLQPVWAGYSTLSPQARGWLPPGFLEKQTFFLPEPSEVEDFVGLPSLKGSGINFFAMAWLVMTRESCSKSKRHLLWDRDLKHFI